MKLEEIQINETGTAFYYNGEKLFDSCFLEVLKFHYPGLAPVKDDSGWYHINLQGEPLYIERFERAFGFYFNRAAVVVDGSSFHIDKTGKRTYRESYPWAGNFQQGLCVVRNENQEYFHIDPDGAPVYEHRYNYAGDFFSNVCCVKNHLGWKHIKMDGSDLNGNYYEDLGIFHKGYAIAKDKNGWFHINSAGKGIYSERYEMIEPFYNGQSLVVFQGNKMIIDESGRKLFQIS